MQSVPGPFSYFVHLELNHCFLSVGVSKTVQETGTDAFCLAWSLHQNANELNPYSNTIIFGWQAPVDTFISYPLLSLLFLTLCRGMLGCKSMSWVISWEASGERDVEMCSLIVLLLLPEESVDH